MWRTAPEWKSRRGVQDQKISRNAEKLGKGMGQGIPGQGKPANRMGKFYWGSGTAARARWRGGLARVLGLV